MTTRAPKDISSYLRLARPRRGAWWRLAVGLVAGTVGFFVVTLVALLAVALVVRLTGHHLVVNTNRVTATLLLATNLGLAACIPLAGLLLWALYGLRPRWLGSVAPGIRRRWLAVCVGITAAVWGTLLVFLLFVTVLSGQATFDGQVVAFIIVVLLTTPLQAAGEEYLFRGFLLQSLGATGLRAPICWVVSGALFATAHGQFAPPLFADRLLIGVVFAWLATSTGGLEASIAIHAVKNVSTFIPAALLGQVSGTIEPTNVTWLPFALDAVLLAVVAPWIRTRYRRQRLPPPPPEVAPGASPVG
ncbi:MAG: protease family protein [Nocardioidaceae bacterium]|nr:protease family protein [Nocardioidaceae bacterium]